MTVKHFTQHRNHFNTKGFWGENYKRKNINKLFKYSYITWSLGNLVAAINVEHSEKQVQMFCYQNLSIIIIIRTKPY